MTSRARCWAVAAALCISSGLVPGSGTAETWVIPDYFPNVSMAALGFSRHETIVAGNDAGATARTRYYLYQWAHTTGTGTFYQSVDEPGPESGEPCPNRPPGVHAGYGRPGAGYDWYAVDEAGFHYLGWMFFYPGGTDGRDRCDVVVGTIAEPYGALAYPRVVIDDAELPGPRDFVLRSRETVYRPDGTVAAVHAESDLAFRLEVLQPGGPGTLLGLRVSLPGLSDWRFTIWLSGPRSCALSSCWLRGPLAKGTDAGQHGIWRTETETGGRVVGASRSWWGK